MEQYTASTSGEELSFALRGFIAEQADGKSDDTARRYEQVAIDFDAFMKSVDVTPWLGPEVANYLESQRQAYGRTALVDALGIVSLVRVMPAFLADPWRPAGTAERRTHRLVTRHIVKFLRVRCQEQGCFRREDFQVLNKAVGSTSYEHATRWAEADSDLVDCTVTLKLRERLLDALLEEVTRDEFATIEAAMAARLNPVPITSWVTPDEAYAYRMGW